MVLLLLLLLPRILRPLRPHVHPLFFRQRFVYSLTCGFATFVFYFIFLAARIPFDSFVQPPTLDDKSNPLLQLTFSSAAALACIAAAVALQLARDRELSDRRTFVQSLRLRREQARVDQLLARTLPVEIAQRRRGGGALADEISDAAVAFICACLRVNKHEGGGL